MKPLECVDFSCPGTNGDGRCSVFWMCLTRLADHLAYLALVFLGGCFFVGVGMIVYAGHAEPAVMTLVTTMTGIFGGIAYTIRQRLDRIEDKKDLKKVAETTAETKVAVETKLEQVAQKLEPISQDVKAAVVAGKVGVQQNVKLLSVTAVIAKDVNGGKEQEKREAYEKGVADQAAKQDSKF